MKILVLCGVLITSVLCSFNIASADCGANFVALSQARGDSGFYHMNNACNEVFEGSRLCTLREVVQSSVQPSYPSEGVQMWVWDETVNPNTACAGWQGGPSGIPVDYPEYGGVVIDPSGNISTAFCNQTMFVACCKPRCCCRPKLSIKEPLR